MGINENWEKIKEIRNKFKDKDNEMWNDKSDVFDFMMTNFEFLLDQLSPEQIPFDIKGKNDAWTYLILELEKKKLSTEDKENLKKLVGTLSLRITMLNNLLNEAKDEIGKMEGLVEQVSMLPCERDEDLDEEFEPDDKCCCISCEARQILED